MLTVVKQKIKSVLDKTTADDKIVAGVKYFKQEYKKNITVALSAALAFVMALYIRDIVQKWIDWFLKLFNISQGTGLIYQTILALVVLTMCVFGIILLSKLGSNKK